MQVRDWAIYNHRSGDHSKCPDWCPATKSGDVDATKPGDSVKEACDKNKTDVMQVKPSLKSANNDATVIRKELRVFA